VVNVALLVTFKLQFNLKKILLGSGWRNGPARFIAFEKL